MPSRESVVARSASALETAEQRAARQVAAAYNQARQELIARLLDGWTATGVLAPDDAARFLRQSGLLQQVDARLQQLEREVGITLRGIVTASSERAIDSIQRELALLPSSIRGDFNPTTFGTINERVIEQFVPVAMSDWRGLTTAMSSNLQRELQTGLIQGEAYPSLVRRLLSQAPGEGAVFPRAQTSAELAVRRLVVAAENGAKQASIAEVSKSIPQIQKQALAAVGITTTDCCLRAHGQIQPVDAPFELVGEPRFADRLMTSPFHWNCRTGIVMYHPFFEGAMPTAKLKEDAAKELQRRKDAKDGRTRKGDSGGAIDKSVPTLAKGDRSGERAIPAPPSVATAPAPESFQYTPAQKQIEQVTERIDQALERAALRNRVSREEFERGVDEGFKKLVAGKDLAIQFKSENIESFLSNPRFKTQFETKSSGGTLNQDTRANAEFYGLGAPLSLDPKDRPIYGYVNLGKIAQREVSQYGDITFILKENVRQRTTVTMDDSLYNFGVGNVVGTPVDNPSKASWDGQLTPLYKYNKTGDLNEIFEEVPYVEIQIQRGVTISDVRGIIDRKGALTTAQRQRFKEMGVEVWDD